MTTSSESSKVLQFLSIQITQKVAITEHFHSTLRKQLMLHVAELVPRHPNRTKKQEPASTSSNAGPSKSGKGGKKKR
ncbi:hypothetical protein CISIN_1g042350mg [Citrus sinensis]|uniref:Uncharacterized protein n=1 Tax=Citrus sinensis TaxID=2711 RepID=A0A067D527_CITSI|nr:hypothetical protein CISIN_1g042350mg [Citrus sinensis]